jgi:hypothetical protein
MEAMKKEAMKKEELKTWLQSLKGGDKVIVVSHDTYSDLKNNKYIAVHKVKRVTGVNVVLANGKVYSRLTGIKRSGIGAANTKIVQHTKELVEAAKLYELHLEAYHWACRSARFVEKIDRNKIDCATMEKVVEHMSEISRLVTAREMKNE